MLVLKGRIIDGTGNAPIENGTLLIEENKISRIVKDEEFKIPEKAEVIEVANGTIMPGLIDLHIHFGMGTSNMIDLYLRNDIQKTMLAVKEMKDILNAGYTSVREAGGLSASFKEPLEKGWVKGPRICSAGQFITQTGGHADMIQSFPVSFNERNTHACIADGIDECRIAARLQFRQGADYLKIMTSGGISSQGDSNRKSQYSVDEIKVFVEEANMHNTYVAAHAQSTQGIKNALMGGVRSIEHGTFMDAECIELMLKFNAILVPTFTVLNALKDNIEKLPVWVAQKLNASYDTYIQSVHKCYEAGVTIGAGSDLLGDPGISPMGINGREFEYLVKIGMTPMESIMAGTKTASRLMKMESEIGTLEEGKLADIVICKGNPLNNISLLGISENIMIVVQDGQIIKNIMR